jgi:hypothetical protein
MNKSPTRTYIKLDKIKYDLNHIIKKAKEQLEESSDNKKNNLKKIRNNRKFNKKD